jgi:hypothetical protein
VPAAHGISVFSILSMRGDLMRRFSGILCVVAMISAGLCWMVYRSVREQAARAAPDAVGALRPERPHDDAASPQLLAMQRELAELRHQVRAQAQREPGETPPAEPPRARDPRTDPEARAESERARHEAIAGVDAAFRGEAMDPRWSATASSTIQTAFASDDKLRPLARGVECRSRTCRVEIADDGSAELNKGLPEIAMRVGRELPNAVYDRVQGADGTPRQIIYFSR